MCGKVGGTSVQQVVLCFVWDSWGSECAADGFVFCVCVCVGQLGSECAAGGFVLCMGQLGK